MGGSRYAEPTSIRERIDRDAAALVFHARRLKQRGWRGLVWLSGTPEQARQQALALWQAADWQAPLWVGDAQQAPVAASLPGRKARTRLGAEHQLVILDASGREGLDPDALGALAGTVSAGGLLVLMTPSAWGSQPDPNYARFADYPWPWEHLSAHYLARMARLLGASNEVVRWPVGGALRLPTLGKRPSAPEPSDDADCLTADQALAVRALVKLKRRRPLVVTADRGRGKSAALGIACARLLQQSDGGEWLLTAPRLSAVESVFSRVAALCPALQRHGPAEVSLANGSRLRFLPPDVLTEHVEQGTLGGSGSTLLVDEAAAIPAALLGRWLAAFPRIAFASTVHGYEGSGRGFALRFRDVLDRQAPQWRELTLQTPIRWSVGDPLEALIQRLLLLNAPLPNATPSQDEVPASVVLSQAQLASQDARLETLFGLLVQSHYRTTPSDLRQLLDGPGTRLRMIPSRDGDDPQAVLVTREEGGFAAELADQVARGERRPQGHLLAQSLAAHGGSRAALTARWRRVARIATHPQRRRQGLGRQLLEEDIESATQQGLSLYGATFGAEASLLHFWLALGFVPVRLGMTREAATGEYAVMVARALDRQGQAVLDGLTAGFAASLPSLLAFELAALPAPVVALLLAALPAQPLGAAERQAIQDVAHARRDPALARPALQALAREASRQPLGEAQQAHQQLAAWAYQNQPLAKAQNDAVQRLREAARQVIAACALFPGESER